MTDLRDCPFCAHKASFDEIEPGGYVVQCSNTLCGVSTPIVYACGDDPLDKLAPNWNARHPDADAHYEMGFRQMRAMAVRLVTAWEAEHEMNQPIADRLRENIARAIRGIPVPDGDR